MLIGLNDNKLYSFTNKSLWKVRQLIFSFFLHVHCFLFLFGWSVDQPWIIIFVLSLCSFSNVIFIRVFPIQQFGLCSFFKSIIVAAIAVVGHPLHRLIIRLNALRCTSNLSWPFDMRFFRRLNYMCASELLALLEVLLGVHSHTSQTIILRINPPRQILILILAD